MKGSQTSILQQHGLLASERNTALRYVRARPRCIFTLLTKFFAVVFFGGALIGFCLARSPMMSPAHYREKSVAGEQLPPRSGLLCRSNHVIIKENGSGIGSLCINPLPSFISTYQQVSISY